MTVALVPVEEGDLVAFKRQMQEAFRLGAPDGVGEHGEVLPEEDVDESLAAAGAVALAAVVDDDVVGGAVVIIDPADGHGRLDLLYVRHGVQSRGLGQAIWQTIEARYPSVEVWETITPYADERNVHFYVNRCGFHVVEFFHQGHPDPNTPPSRPGLPQPPARMLRLEKKRMASRLCPQ